MKPPSSIRAFTLVEMVITLAVFVLLSAAVFGIVTGVLESAASLQDNQNRTDKIMALQAFLKKELGGLPTPSSLISYRRGDGEGLDQNGIIFGPNNFLTAIDAKVQINGLYELRLATFTPSASNLDAMTAFQRELTSDDTSLQWLILIHDIKHVEWKFQDPNNSAQWDDLWSNRSLKPNLVEFSIEEAGDLRSTLMDFWIPTIYPPPSSLPAVEAPLSTTNTAPQTHAP